MTDIEVQESYTDHDGGKFSAVSAKVVATWPAPNICGEPRRRLGRRHFCQPLFP